MFAARALPFLLALIPAAAEADSLVATRLIEAKAVIGEADIALVAAAIPGALSDPALALGQEARVTIYPGRPLREDDIGPPALIERNTVVPLIFQRGALEISTEGRALDRGGTGDVIRVMNLSSRSIVTGRIDSLGQVQVASMAE